MTLFISAFAVTTGNIMIKPEYYNQSKPKPKEEVLIERKCNMCGKLAKMGKFQRYCGHHCKAIATKIDNTNYNVRIR